MIILAHKESQCLMYLGLLFLQPSQSFTNSGQECDGRKQAALELSGPSPLMTATDTRHVLGSGLAGADRSGHTPHEGGDVRVGGEGRVRRKKNGNIDFWWFVARRQKSRLVQKDWYGINKWHYPRFKSDSLKATGEELVETGYMQ